MNTSSGETRLCFACYQLLEEQEEEAREEDREEEEGEEHTLGSSVCGISS